MICGGECLKYKAKKVFGASNRYEHGDKRCNMCCVFIKWDGVRCPCCDYVLRTTSKNRARPGVTRL